MLTALKRIVLMMAGAVLIAGVTPALAQETLVANVPFRFVAAGHTYAPGTYDFRFAGDEPILEFGLPSGPETYAGVITRLAESQLQPMTTGKLVFDKVGSVYHLAQLWEPDRDGYLLAAPTEPTGHAWAGAGHYRTR